MDTSRGFLIALVLALGGIAAMLAMPFLQFLLLAILLVYVLYPVQKRLAPRIGPGYSAFVLVTLTSLLVLLPLFLVFRSVFDQAQTLYAAIRDGEVTVALVEDTLENALGVRPDLKSMFGNAPQELGSTAFDEALGIFDLVTHVLIGLGITAFLLYYFLKDGDAFVDWLRDVIPLPDDVVTELFDEFDNVMWAVIAGHVFVAAIQGGIAGIGLFVTGIPNALFWTVVMMVLALLPIVGAPLVWGPAALYLLGQGDTAAAVGLTIYGTIVVGVTDDYLRPVVVDRRANLNPAVILFGIIGGVYVLGAMGIFFGPVVLGVLKATIDVFDEKYEDL
ncbi:AI-2E family transporter [Halostella sp. JP-L12]|uniref:AI-2E family transporter n=1 Tax=Halostella TaxID=1843185 RepID=UPI000EF7DB0D|nr:MULTISPECIES: AI-2E family transporter [Halostella]NHN47016.1 AI-2E family transporter [Halostella sp. JP-L12]